MAEENGNDQQLAGQDLVRQREDSLIVKLTSIEGFDISESRMPHGNDLLALSEVICYGIDYNAITYRTVIRGIYSLFDHACRVHEQYGMGFEGAWAIVYDRGPWHRLPFKFANFMTLKTAVELYYDGLKTLLRSGRCYSANHEQTPTTVLVLSNVAKWAEMSEGVKYEVMIGPGDLSGLFDERDEDGEPSHKRQRLSTDLTQLTQRFHQLQLERDLLKHERDVAVAERDAAITQRDAAITQRDAAITQRDALIEETVTELGEIRALLGALRNS
ncbi:hypothetical protein F4821DRAFT_260389 [Hypoxylon rubiginosum]|uniref:Uncharacterized protein n=1 Tax=Hypoxylon rubiginosum TaxID=110542 RepID=A0ACC0D182_9PEZI|nr:hypothetical protein F4821DRAFT_260389 [Hypoxylon rubiginosum]